MKKKKSIKKEVKRICPICDKHEGVICHYLHEEKKLEGDHRLWYLKHPEWFQWICTICSDKIHGIEPKKSELKFLVINRDRELVIRNARESQIRGFSRIEYIVPEAWDREVKDSNERIKLLEKQIKVLIEKNGYKITEWLMSVKGISYNTVAKLISFIDINHSPTISALWRYCGLDATHIRRTKKITQAEAKKFGNPYLKKELLGVIGDSFIKQRTPLYRELYDTEKEHQMKVNGLPKGHAHRRAIRKMIKIFVSHLWLKWREVENLPVSQPYVIERLGHKNLIKVG